MGNPPPLRLFMIYAGRGDAFILEWGPANDRKLTLIDGGPMSWVPLGSGLAPYHRYLSSAIKTIVERRGGQAANFLDALSSVIISHPDEDHFGGYTTLLAGTGTRVSGPSIPAFVPQGRDENDMTNQRLDDAFLGNPKNPLRKQGSLDPNVNGPYLDGPIRPIFPPIEQIRCYSGVYDTRISTHDKFTGIQNTNSRSILMLTDPQVATGSKPMFFTGDNDANTILGQMQNQLNDPDFSVYKIQHHGSRADSQVGGWRLRFSDEVRAEGTLYALHYFRKGDSWMLPQLFANQGVAIAIQLLLKFEAELSPQDQKTYFKHLKVRHDKYLACLEGIDRPKDLEYPAQTLYPPKEGPHLDPSPVKLLDSINHEIIHSKTISRIAKNGWSDYKKAAETAGFMGYWQIRNIKRFYSQFSSDVYVVSAASQHGHPSAETLIGLALAVQDHYRKARLYLTAGFSLDVKSLKGWVDFLELGFMDHLFQHDNLRISYLSQGAYMVLTGCDGTHIDREVLGVTKEIEFDYDSPDPYAELKDLLERKPNIVLAKQYKVFVGSTPVATGTAVFPSRNRSIIVVDV